MLEAEVRKCHGGGVPPPEVRQIYRRLIRRHNARCWLKGLLFLLGGVSQLALVLAFGLALWAVFLGEGAGGALPGSAWTFAATIVVGVFWLGVRRLRAGGEAAWETVLDRGGRRSGGSRVAARMGREWSGVGFGIGELFLLGPQWLRRAWQYVTFRVRGRAQWEELEKMRRDLAARESWEPVRHFQKHEREIGDLLKLGLVVIRQHEGEWCLRVSLSAQEIARELGKGWSGLE
ncbi:MAG: hypothetical protein ACQKBY_09925, partial [Verrucomicrobiales bacterium]